MPVLDDEVPRPATPVTEVGRSQPRQPDSPDRHVGPADARFGNRSTDGRLGDLASGDAWIADPAGWLRHLLLFVALVVAVLPAVLAGHRAIDQGWRPVLDNERLAVDAASFGTGHPPLLGARSTSLENSTGVRPVHHLGPSESWLFGTVQAVWSGTTSLVVSAAALAAAGAAVVVLSTRRIGGAWAGLAAGAVTGMATARLGTPILADIWNPFVPLLPLAAAVTASWAGALTRWRPGLPLAVLFGTISAQSHLTHGPLLVVAIAPTVLAWWFDRRARRRAECAGSEGSAELGDGADRLPPSAAERPEPSRKRLLGLVVAGVIGFVLWLPPVLSDLTSGQSNLVKLWQSTTKGTGYSMLGAGYGLGVFTRVVGRPPPFGPPAVGAGSWIVPEAVSFGVIVHVVLVLAPIVAVLLYGLLRRDRLCLVIGASVLATDAMAIGLMWISTYSTGAGLYQTRWLWSIAILHWGGVVVSALHVARSWRPASRKKVGLIAPVLLNGVVIIVALAAVAGAVRPLYPAAVISPDVRMRMDAASELQAGLGGDLAHQRLIVRADLLLSPSTNVALDLSATLITERVDVRITSADPELRRTFGGHYAAGRNDRGVHLVVTNRSARRAMTRSGYRQVASTPPLTSAERKQLAALTRQLRRELIGSKVRWSLYGSVINFGQRRPDVNKMLRENVLGTRIFSGELQGRFPARTVVETFTDLRRRSRPDTSFILWRRPDRRLESGG